MPAAGEPIPLWAYLLAVVFVPIAVAVLGQLLLRRKASVEEVSELRAEVARLRADCRSLQAENADIRREREQCNERIEELRAQNLTLLQRINELTTKLLERGLR